MHKVKGYSLDERLSQRFLTMVYRGVRLQDNTPVVIKIPRSEYPSPRELARLRREFNIGVSLQTDCVPRYLALEEQGHALALVMHDFGGRSLKRAGAGPMALAEFLPIALKVVDALREIHRHNIIHRDINPNNIVLNTTTDEVKVIDFSIASQLSRESVVMHAPDTVEGSLDYIAPEQTGRLSRPVDYRADYYSLGATFYELLSGAPPFKAADRGELLFSHIARRPASLSSIRADVPPMLSAIIDKLLEKDPADRYQSTFGLRSDLERCHSRAGHHDIETFALGRADVPERLHPPQKLYGRQEQVKALLAAFERANKESRELVLVSGRSGIGKSSLVAKIRDTLAARRGYFASGKFDQTRRDRPYSAIIDACDQLLQQIMADDPKRVAAHKETLKDNLGAARHAMAELLPALEPLLTEPASQEPAPFTIRDPANAKRHLLLGFRRFLETFAGAEHPLVLFLDDLQWADAPSLDLLQALIAGNALPGLLVIGAYRTHEVTAAAWLTHTIETIEKRGVRLTRIELAPLDEGDVRTLISDMLRATPEAVERLAQIVSSKTHGNPFFVHAFLSSLHEQELLWFETTAGRWRWRMTEIEQLPITDNVADILQLSIRSLSTGAELLAVCACLGDEIELGRLARVHGEPAVEVAAQLEEALHKGLLAPIGDTYKYARYQQEPADGPASDPSSPSAAESSAEVVRYRFTHDRIREAAYALQSDEQRAVAHLAIGRGLLRDTPAVQIEESVFDIADQFNLAGALIVEPQERRRVAELNTSAGQRALAAAAFSSAIHYFKAARTLLSDADWERDHQQLFELQLSLARSHYLNGDHTLAEQQLQALLGRARDDVEHGRAALSLTKLQNDMQAPARAVESAFSALRHMGEEIPESPEALQEAIERGRDEAEAKLSKLRVEELRYGTAARTPREETLTQLYHWGSVTSLMANRPIRWLAINRLMLHLADTAPAAATEMAYALHAYGQTFIAGKEQQRGLSYLRTAKRLGKESGDANLEHMMACSYALSGQYWEEHALNTLEPIRQALRYAIEVGDVNQSTGAPVYLMHHYMFCGVPLAQMVSEAETYLVNAKRTGNAGGSLSWRYRFLLELSGQEGRQAHLPPERDEVAFVKRCQAQGTMMLLLNMLLAKLPARVHIGDVQEAQRLAHMIAPRIHQLKGFIPFQEFYFYAALALSAVEPSEHDSDTAVDEELLRHSHELLSQWAQLSPVNFKHRFLLIDAEMQRRQGNHSQAFRSYDAALDGAHIGGFIQNVGIAAERAVQLCIAAGQRRSARAYLEEAVDAYTRWGAQAVVARLQSRFSAFLTTRITYRPEPSHTPDSTSSGTMLAQLDIETVIEATQSIAGEIRRDNLLHNMVGTVMKYAGASRMVLIFRKDKQLLVEADGRVEPPHVEVLQSIPIDDYHQAPAAIIRLVEQLKRPVLLDGTSTDQRVTAEPYFTTRQVRSVFCGPILHRGDLSGVLYLENDLIGGAFTPSRVRLLGILASQVAISIENARLYEDLGRTVERVSMLERERLMTQLSQFQAVVEASSDCVGLLSKDGEVLYLNPAGMAHLGRSGEAYAGWGLEQLYPEPVRRQLVDDIFPQIAEAGSWTGELSLLRADGTTRPVSQSFTLVRNAAGEAIGFGGIARDITMRKRREAELHRARGQAEAASRAKSQFLANMSHEIRTPMNAIIGMTQLMRDTPLADYQRQHVDIINESADALLELINDILDLSKIEARELIIEQALFNVRSCLESALDLFATKVLDKGILLACKVDPHMPSAILGDAYRVRQILVNLIGNAVKFTDRGRVTVRLDSRRLSASGAGDNNHELHFVISDTGIGIPEDKLGHIFQPFTQGDASTTRKHGGTGLGLAICKQLADKMGADLYAESQLGQGSSFHFILRARAISSKQPLFVAAEQPVLAGQHVAVKAHDAFERELLVDALRHWQMQVSVVSPAAAVPDGVKAVITAGPLDVGDEQSGDKDARPKSGVAAEEQARVVVAPTQASGEPNNMSVTRPIKLVQLHHALTSMLSGRLLEHTADRPTRARRKPTIKLDKGMALRCPLTILLAEDNPVNRTVAQRMLQRMGYRADSVSDGHEVLRAVAERDYDIVLLDIQMPGMDGMQAMREIHRTVSSEQRPFIVALTALAMEGDRQRLLEAGADAYVSKPLRLGTLIEVLERCYAARAASPKPGAS